jgi:D-inositol-3-phosphate glycosyltransferase
MARIILVGSAYPFRGGLANFNERLIREFNRLGHEAEIVTFTAQYPSFLFPGKSQFIEEPAPADLKITRLVHSFNPFNWLNVASFIRKKNPDILIFKYWLPFMAPCFGTIARRVKKNKHTKVMAILDNVIPHEKRPGDKSFTNYFLKSCDGFIAMSQNVADDLKKFIPDPNLVLQPHPLYDNFGEAISKQQALKHLQLDAAFHYLLFFGFIRKYKGLDLLLEAMSDARIRSMSVKAIVAGEFYEDEKPYLEMIRRLGIQDKLILKTDFIPDAEVKYYFSACDGVVQPYHHATQSGVTQIAYQFNKPMIVTNVGGLPELVPNQKTGLVVEPNAKAIADAIVEFYKERLENSFIQNIQTERQKFSWTRMAEAILRIS